MAPILRRLFNYGQGADLKAQLIRGAMGVGGLKLLSLPLTLATSILLARRLGPEGYGQYVFVLAVISLLALPVGPGLGQLVTREVAKYHYGEDWGLFRGLLRRAHQWVILGSVVTAAVIALFAARNGTWAADDRWTLLFIATLMLPLLGLNALRAATLRGLRKVFYAQLPELLARPGLHLFIVAGLLLAGMLNPLTALASQIAATVLAFCVGAWILRRYRPRPVREAELAYETGEWARSLFPFTLLVGVSTLNGQVGILVLGTLGTSEGVAILQVAQSGAMLVAISQVILSMVMGPYVVRAYKNRDIMLLQRLIKVSSRTALFVSLPVALPLIFIGGPIVNLVYGEGYSSDAVIPLAILCVGQLINVAIGPLGMFLSMAGYEKDTLVAQVIGLLFSSLFAFTLVPLLGVVGAASAVTIGLVSWNLALVVRFKSRLGVRPTAF